jgi:hypothetical protein
MTMRRKRSASHLRLLFVLAVVIPCLVLGVIAIRSINREEAFIKMRLQGTIDAELVHMVSLLNADLERIREELVSSLTGNEFSSPQTALAGWKARSGLVGVPFLLSPDLKIVWPSLSGMLSENERGFLNWNREFITGRAPIPVYQNIALVYKDEITKTQESLDKDVQEAPKTAILAGESRAFSPERERPPAPPEEKPGIRSPKTRLRKFRSSKKR